MKKTPISPIIESPIPEPPANEEKDPNATYYDPYDKEKLYELKNTFYNQQLTRNKEISVLRDKLRWCYRREGVNYLQNCRELTLEYLQVLRSGFLTHFKAPSAKDPAQEKNE